MTGLIEGIEKFDSPGRGRGLRVTRPFKVGELLFSSPAYSYVLSFKEKGSYCDFCFNSVALINHSCLPTVIVTYNGTSAEVRAVQDMKPGDEVRKRHACH
ncbi:hypothetical protein GOODEAATRI_009954 [Goodea atripinnis]|uniref:SET domain-containing protein n=1 Tax=Goodea atripinnis TaxID=208336 RepID=A0ABV0NUZ1_9TELE